ncbi:MAG: hypothetical protein K8R99_13305 [Actinomycetia bacterium]|nr:hypothetical protein [Actinomycetes bacterium]
MRRRLVSLAVFGGLVVFQLAPAHAALVDADGDKIPDEQDVCPAVADPFQGDIDGDGLGDLCDEATTDVTSFDGTPLNDLVFGTNAADTLAGAGANDALYGEEGDDVLDGGDGRDFLSGGPGGDTLTGGGSCDVFAFDPSDSDVITDFDPEIDRLRFPAHDENPSDDAPPQATFGGDEFLVVTFLVDDAPAGTLDFEGLEPGVEIALNTGPCQPLPPNPPPGVDDESFVPVSLPPPRTFSCSPMFSEPVLGDSDDDGVDDFFGIEFAFDGVFLNGTAENETIFGTHCSDLIAGDGGLLVVPLNEESDFDLATCATEICSDDVIYGFAGNDLLVGDARFLDGFQDGGDDRIFGGGDDDFIIGDAILIAGDELCECEGESESGDFGSGGGGGNDVIFGDSGDDLILGDAFEIFGDVHGGDDTLNGGNGDDLLIGDAFSLSAGASGGDDTLIGGAGDDTLVGDGLFVDGFGGHDTFVFDTTSNFGDDTIVDAGYELDTISFTGPGLTTLADLDARSTVEEVGFDVFARVFSDATKTTQVGSVTIEGMATGSIASWADVDGLLELEVVVTP